MSSSASAPATTPSPAPYAPTRPPPATPSSTSTPAAWPASSARPPPRRPALIRRTPWFFLTSHATGGRALDVIQRKHNVVLPCPDTGLDMGRMLTHKDLIARLHPTGHTTPEIARQTHHNPRSVEAYLKTFDAVLVLHLYRIPPQLPATILGHGTSLTDGHHQIMRSYLKGPETGREHLTAQGVKIPAQAFRTA